MPGGTSGKANDAGRRRAWCGLQGPHGHCELGGKGQGRGTVGWWPKPSDEQEVCGGWPALVSQKKGGMAYALL